MPFPRRFFSTDPATLARALLGQRLVRVLDDGTRLAGLIVETEAYLGPRDRAAHSFGGRRTPRNEAMYGRGGTAYVYFTYGMHYCFNVVAGDEGEPVAVLIRALEPTEGIERMLALRSGSRPRRKALAPAALCRGPANLCQALAIARSLNGIDLTRDPRLFVEQGLSAHGAGVVRTPRIGIDYAGHWAKRLLRFHLHGHPAVSGRRSRASKGA